MFCICAFSNEIEKKFITSGLVDISTIDRSIKVDLVNSNADKNFFGENFYDGLQKCYLQKAVAKKLSNAQKILKNKYPKYSLKMMDCTRPRSVSQKMYDRVKNTPFKRFVANPKTGSMHNFGSAVDIFIVDENGKSLDFGMNPFYRGKYMTLLNYGMNKLSSKLSSKQKKNRELLSNIMKKAGFKPLSFEWWHFNGFSKSYIRKTYKIVE